MNSIPESAMDRKYVGAESGHQEECMGGGVTDISQVHGLLVEHTMQ